MSRGSNDFFIQYHSTRPTLFGLVCVFKADSFGGFVVWRYDCGNYKCLSAIVLVDFDFIQPIAAVPADMIDRARVVLVDLANISPVQAQAFEAHLDAAEQGRLREMTRDDKRHAFVVCRFVVKQLIGEFFCIDPKVLSFQYTERGKPYVSVPGIEFNISHSGDFALIGVSRSKIGVDIEKIKPNRNFEGLAKTVLSEDERRWVFEEDQTRPPLAEVGEGDHVAPSVGRKAAEIQADLAFPSESSIRRFYQLWTLKEARLKCDGDGLAGHFPAAILSGNAWGYPGYETATHSVKNEYIYTLCMCK